MVNNLKKEVKKMERKDIFKGDWYMAVKKVWGKKEYEVVFTNLKKSNIFKVYGKYNNKKEAIKAMEELSLMDEKIIKEMFRDEERPWISFTKPIKIIKWQEDNNEVEDEDEKIKKAIEISYKDLAKGEYRYLGIAIPIKALIEKVKKWNYKEDDIIKVIKLMYYNNEVEFFYGNENTLIIGHKGYYYMAIKYLEEEVI